MGLIAFPLFIHHAQLCFVWVINPQLNLIHQRFIVLLLLLLLYNPAAIPRFVPRGAAARRDDATTSYAQPGYMYAAFCRFGCMWDEC